jgi:hypothetical protein
MAGGLPPDIIALIEGEKTLGVTPKWDKTSDPRYLEILTPLAVGEVTTGGFEIRVKISKQFVDRDAVAQLEFAMQGRRSAVALWRLDWKPFAPHDNNGVPETLGETIFGSHEHRFHDNYIVAEHRMRAGNLPWARGLNTDPGTLSDFLALWGERFRIKDIRRMRLPTVTADLFWTKDG